MRFRFPDRRLVKCAVLGATILGLAWSAAGSAAPVTSAPSRAASEHEKPRLAVLDFNVGEDIKTGHGVALGAIVREECQNSQRYDLMDRNMMKERMTEKDFAATTECDEVRCLVRYGKTLDVHKIIGGFATSFGKSWMVTLRMVDVNTGREEKTFSQDCRGDMECLLALSRQGARVLLGLEPDALAPVPAKAPAHPAGDVLTLDLGAGVKMELVLIPAGEFLMGSPDGEGDSDENPRHHVRISRPFYMGRTEVTQAQWQAVMGNNPSKFKGDGDLPVEQVSWEDCQEFCRRLSGKAGRTIRLPTEAEWEYACRAGTSTRFSFGDAEGALGEYAWYGANSGLTTHPVGQKKPNTWGLHDMYGNIWEWCADWYELYSPEERMDLVGPASGTMRVLRGGYWSSGPSLCRSAERGVNSPGGRYDYFGFRCSAGTE